MNHGKKKRAWFIIAIALAAGISFAGCSGSKSSTNGGDIAVTGVTLNKSTTSILVGGYEPLTSTISPSNATNQNINWFSNASGIATVDSAGKVTGVSAGTAIISATSSSDSTKTAICTVTVSATPVSVTGVTLNPTTLSLSAGTTSPLAATIAPSGATKQTVTWLSSNTTVATVSTSGLVTASTAGDTTITVTTDDGAKTATCLVTVTASLTNPAGLVLSTPPAMPFSTVAGDSTTYTAANFFVATSYGASTGNTDNATYIQAAITAAKAYGTSSNPGIVVLNGGGTFLSSPITLYSNVYLKIESGTTLKALSMASYLTATGGSKVNFISATSASNFGIYGSGIIDGNGGNGSAAYSTFSANTTCWWGNYLVNIKPVSGTDNRPRTVYFTLCNNILIQGVTIQNSPSMHVMTSGGSNIVLSGVTIQSPAVSTTGETNLNIPGTSGDSPNTDGFDPGGNTSGATSNIWVDNCTFDTGDDCIAVKSASSSSTPGVSKMYVTNSKFYHGHGVSFGGQTTYGVTNYIMNNCSFYGTQYGIKIKSDRTGTNSSAPGGPCHELQYTNLTMTNVGYPIWFAAYYKNTSFWPNYNGTDPNDSTGTSYSYITNGTPYYYNILVQNLTINQTTSGAITQYGRIVGLPEKPFTNIVLQGITVNITAGSAPTGSSSYGGGGLWVRDATIYTHGNTTITTSIDSSYGGVVTPY
jgi:polygalacturonase